MLRDIDKILERIKDGKLSKEELSQKELEILLKLGLAELKDGRLVITERGERFLSLPNE
jgi:hypothetical protein